MLRRRRVAFGASGRRSFNIRRVIVVVRPGDRVLSRVGKDHELLRAAAADLAAVRVHHPETQAEPLEDRDVGVVHLAITLLEAGLVDVERVGVFHDEFAGPHYAEPRPDLIAELDLYLVEIDGQLLVAAQLASCDVGNDFFVRGAKAEFPVVPVVHAQQQVAVLVPAPGFSPEFGGLYGRHDDFESAGPVHFLAHDFFHLA